MPSSGMNAKVECVVIVGMAILRLSGPSIGGGACDANGFGAAGVKSFFGLVDCWLNALRALSKGLKTGGSEIESFFGTGFVLLVGCGGPAVAEVGLTNEVEGVGAKLGGTICVEALQVVEATLAFFGKEGVMIGSRPAGPQSLVHPRPCCFSLAAVLRALSKGFTTGGSGIENFFGIGFVLLVGCGGPAFAEVALAEDDFEVEGVGAKLGGNNCGEALQIVEALAFFLGKEGRRIVSRPSSGYQSPVHPRRCCFSLPEALRGVEALAFFFGKAGVLIGSRAAESSQSPAHPRLCCFFALTGALDAVGCSEGVSRRS